MKKMVPIFLICISFFNCKKTSQDSTQKIPETIQIESGLFYDVTYEDYNNNSDEKKMATNQIVDLFDTLAWEDGSFITIEISATNVLQFMNEGGDKFLVEITNETDNPMTFHQKFATKEECKEIVNTVLNAKELDAVFLSTFYKVPIMTKTLKEVMAEQSK